jgi:hypothetical protein
MTGDTWFWRSTVAIAAICSVTLLGVQMSRDDPAEACRAQVLDSELRTRDRAWEARRGAELDAATIRGDIAKLPRWPHPLRTPWLMDVRQ